MQLNKKDGKFRLFGRYLMEKRRIFLLWGIWIGIAATVFKLYRITLEPLLYASVLCIVVGAGYLLGGFIRWERQIEDLHKIIGSLDEKVLPLPRPYTAVEEEYQTLLNGLSHARFEERRGWEQKIGEMLDFYTLWVHQIKTPIAAMRLLLQSDEEETVISGPLQGELTRIEGYAEMVLSYLRLQSETTDYLFRKVEVDPIIRSTLRRFARLFIGGKLSVAFQGTGMVVVTDEKWFSVVLEQVLSNSVKYTPPGGTVSIAAENRSLIISDTGIGIRKEDLPRVFERGYTGFNGHDEHHSSGLGLYLCREIMDGLGGSIAIDSIPGKGTKVTLTFPDRTEEYE